MRTHTGVGMGLEIPPAKSRHSAHPTDAARKTSRTQVPRIDCHSGKSPGHLMTHLTDTGANGVTHTQRVAPPAPNTHGRSVRACDPIFRLLAHTTRHVLKL